MSEDRAQGIAALQQGDLTNAIASLERALQADPNDYQSATYLGAAYAQAERASDAVTALTQAVQIQPSNPQARFNLGVALQKAGWNEQAITAYEQALTLQPDYVQAQQALNALRPQAPTVPPTGYAPTTQAYTPQPSYTPPQQGYAPPVQQPSASPAGKENPYAAGYNPALAQAYQNTSGMNSDVPFEVGVCRWNWGAFCLTFLWLFNHGMVKQGVGYIALYLCGFLHTPLLSMLSSFGTLIMSIYFGAKGHELAWKNRRFDSVDHYFSVQRKWLYWGVGITVAFTLFVVIAVALAIGGSIPAPR